MCIIIYKPKNILFPSDKILENCYNDNPDGIGLSWNNGHRTHLHKGFMTLKAFLKYIEPIKDTLNQCDTVIHFRYSTHGSTSQYNTHPFIVSHKINDLKRLHYSGFNTIISHNGIISGKDYIDQSNNDLSDTMIFTKKFSTLGENHKSIQKILNQGKFAVLSPNNITLYGNFIHESSGIYYSNDSYKDPIKYTFRNKTQLYIPDISCKKEKVCLASGKCFYSGDTIEEEMTYGDIDFCPLADDYFTLNYKFEDDDKEEHKPISKSNVNMWVWYDEIMSKKQVR